MATSNNQLSILINAYAIAPHLGSEQGMGWNWMINLARHCTLHVITEGEWKDDIAEELKRLPQAENIHLYYNPVNDKIRRMCWNQGDWRFYWYYRKWQLKTLDIAREIIANNHIDVMHQLNMIGFREPGYLWRIKDIPLVWGPIGGMVNIPTTFLKGAGLKMNLFVRLKNTISDAQLRFHPRVRKMIKRSTMLAATSDTVRSIKRVYGIDIPLINETGVSPIDYIIGSKTDSGYFELLWIGKFDFRKRLDLALRAVAATGRKDVRLTVVGTGADDDVTRYKALAKSLGIDTQVVWLGRVSHDKINQLMHASDLFFFTSISEATSTVVLEAVQCGLPVLSMDACGFGPIVKEFAGKAIAVTDPDTVIAEFSQAICRFADNPAELQQYSQQEFENAQRHTWQYKAMTVAQLYRRLLPQ